jgi:DNA-binding response OmpR family regulator
VTGEHTVLVVEDDPAMREGLRDNLEAEGYRVALAGSAAEAQEAVASADPSLILLDWMLPDGDGVSLCRQLRAQGFERPIVMLTARGQEIDKVLGLEMGADDYVVKPFGLLELLARVKAHLRQHTPAQAGAQSVTVGLARADFEHHRLTRGGEVVAVTAKEMELLRFLVAHRGEVVSRERLLAEVWGHRAEITTRTVDNFVARLRKKIEPRPASPRHLITVYGRGYKLVPQ